MKLKKGQIINRFGRAVYSHWFFFNDENQSIHTYGLGDFPQNFRRYESKEEYLNRKKELKEDGWNAIEEN